MPVESSFQARYPLLEMDNPTSHKLAAALIHHHARTYKHLCCRVKIPILLIPLCLLACRLLRRAIHSLLLALGFVHSFKEPTITPSSPRSIYQLFLQPFLWKTQEVLIASYTSLNYRKTPASPARCCSWFSSAWDVSHGLFIL